MSLRSALDFYCPVCFEVFRDPVLLSCSHSFCNPCLQRWWTQKSSRDCPVCKRRSSKGDPPCNLVLKNLCEAFSQELSLTVEDNDVCPQHGEKLKLFCLQHQQLVCLVCRDSRAHLSHSFRPVDEAAQDYRRRLKENLRPLQIRLDEFEQIQLEWVLTAAHVEEQGRQTECLIRGEFENMRAFLQREEEARVGALRSDVAQKRSLMEQRMAALETEMRDLSEVIKRTEAELQSRDVAFLKIYNTLVKRVEENLSVRKLDVPLGLLVDVAKHLGNLTFTVWSKMKDLVTFTPVVLDPNTACSLLRVSDDLRSVRYRTEVDAALPDNHERFKYFVTVLGAEGYISGTHRWDVELQGNTDWAVGVIAQSMRRKDRATSPGSWTLWRRGQQCVAFAPPFVEEVLQLRQTPLRIRVELDCQARTLSFFNPITESLYYTFTDLFSERLYPCIDTLSPTPLTVLPLDVSVQTKASCI